jgi:folate-dependent phosphoribosylglycinamide formyltransferase PurN
MTDPTLSKGTKKLVVLCADGPHHKYLISQLLDRFCVAGIVIEPEASKRKRLWARRKKDYFFALYHYWRRKLLLLDAYRARYFLVPAEPRAATCRTLITESINDVSVIELLTEIRPDLTIVMGTSILRSQTLEAAGTAINIHGGFLPYYRGNHCFFFALYEGKFDRIGSTIHFVDAGIDTGDIIEHVVPPLRAGDNAEKLYSRAERMAIHRLTDLLHEFEQGYPLPRHAQPAVGRTIRTRDRKLHHDIAYWLRRKTGKEVLPN